MAEDADSKKDLTRLDTFTGGPAVHTEEGAEPSAESEFAGPDLGTLLGLKPATETVPELEAPQPESNVSIPSLETSSTAGMHGGAADLAPGEFGPPETPFAQPENFAPPAAQPAPGSDAGMEQLRRFSERMSVGKDHVPAAFPFSLMIEGHLLVEEREKLLDLLSRENLEIREVDLEPQFTEGRILIPRVSEFVCVMIVQALRSCSARIRLGPADEIFSTEDTRTRPEELLAPSEQVMARTQLDSTHPAESLPVTSDSSLPEIGPYTVVDVVAASAALSVGAVEAERTTEYQEMVEALQRELKFKAWRKGASAILNFAVQLDRLSLPSRYRILVTGSAVRGTLPGPS